MTKMDFQVAFFVLYNGSFNSLGTMVENAFWGVGRQLWAPCASFDAGRGRGVRAREGTSLSRAAQVAKRSHTMTFCRRSSTVTKGRRCLPSSTTSTYWSLDDDLQQLQKVSKKTYARLESTLPQ